MSATRLKTGFRFKDNISDVARNFSLLIEAGIYKMLLSDKSELLFSILLCITSR